MSTYLFQRPQIPYDFLKRIMTFNFRDIRNSMPVVVSELLKIKLKNAFSAPKIGQPAITFGTAIIPKFFGGK